MGFGEVVRRVPWLWLLLAAAAAYPAVPGTDPVFGGQLVTVFVFAVLALGLNVVLGYAGILHLGIAAFFGIGAYVAGILMVRQYPFQWGFAVVLPLAGLAAAALGVVTTAPMLRLRGDYLALVTLGFGQITVFAIRNLENVTDGTRGLTPISPDLLPLGLDKSAGVGTWWRGYPGFYYLTLGLLAVALVLLRNLERSRLGRAWVALREDELAAACSGLSPARLKLSAIALGAGLAGLAGCLYATGLRSTAGPQAFDFNRSIFIVCCVILGGLGSRAGVVFGVFLLAGFDNVLTPVLDNWVQQQDLNPAGVGYRKVSGWRLFLFGLTLVLMMRFRPEGLFPSSRVRAELHADDEVPVAGRESEEGLTTEAQRTQGRGRRGEDEEGLTTEAQRTQGM